MKYFAALALFACVAKQQQCAAQGCDGWPAAKEFCNGPAKNFEKGIGYPKADTMPGPLKSTDVECCCACAADATCNGWTLNPKNGGTCFLKKNAGPSFSEPNPHTVSGLMPARPPPPPYTPPYPTPKGAKNVLFLAVDDMRPSLGAYNFTLPGQPTHSPNLDKLASEGLVFTHAYVQYAYCSPSRNSFMTGRRPDTTKVWEFVDHFREVGVGADWTSMPEYFKQHGYLTLGNGKLYHPSSTKENIGMPFMDWPASWSPEIPYFFPKDDVSQTTCVEQGPTALAPGNRPSTGKEHGTMPYAWCAMDIDKDDSVLFGQQVRNNCMKQLETYTTNANNNNNNNDNNNNNNNTTTDNENNNNNNTTDNENTDNNGNKGGGGGGTRDDKNSDYARPFFIGCGFHKPHAPHYAPKEFYDRLPHWSEVPLPLDQFAPVGMPQVAWHPYADVAGMVETPAFNGTVNNTRLHQYRKAYYASISYTDYNIGQILNKLEAVGHKDDTIAIVFGDHGYQLGEHDTWAKMTNFELGVHIPLIIRVPWMQQSRGRESAVLAEMVDIFPTLAALAGLPDPRTVVGSTGINGTSLAPVFEDPTNVTIKTAAFSQFSKNNVGTNVDPKYCRNATQLMGYSVRTDEWRYTAWFLFNSTGARGPFRTEGVPDHFGTVMLEHSLGTELYDHRGDTGKWLDWEGENVNLANYTEHASVVATLHAKIVDYIQLDTSN